MDNLPEGSIRYNMRAYEARCSNENGLALERWYWIDVMDRTWKVAGMVLPGVADMLKAQERVR